MNIFILDLNPQKAAEYHSNKHVIKMSLETAQLLSTVIYKIQGKVEDGLYKPTHLNHPCVLWAGETVANYKWLINLGIALCEEYTKRYNKKHKSETVILNAVPYSDLLPIGNLTQFAQVMPDDVRDTDVVKAYRQYYIKYKSPICVWKSKIPYWVNAELEKIKEFCHSEDIDISFS